MLAIKRLIPHLFTAGNLVGGILAIIFTLQGHTFIAPYFILISAVFDFLDGFVARLLKVQSELGKQLDSLADMVTFGVAPGIIVYSLLKTNLGSQGAFEYLPYLAFVIPVFALFRLAKFNLDERQSEGFIGVPTPAMTIFFASIPLLIADITITSSPLKLEIIMAICNPVIMIILAVIFSILMVSEIPLFALKFKSFKWRKNEVRYIFLTISLILLATLFVWALPLIIVLYIVLSLIINLIKKPSTNEI